MLVIRLMMVIIFSGQAYDVWPLALAVLLTGLVCSARLIASDHTKEDIILGLIVGIFTQVFAWWI